MRWKFLRCDEEGGAAAEVFDLRQTVTYCGEESCVAVNLAMLRQRFLSCGKDLNDAAKKYIYRNFILRCGREGSIAAEILVCCGGVMDGAVKDLRMRQRFLREGGFFRGAVP